MIRELKITAAAIVLAIAVPALGFGAGLLISPAIAEEIVAPTPAPYPHWLRDAPTPAAFPEWRIPELSPEAKAWLQHRLTEKYLGKVWNH